MDELHNESLDTKCKGCDKMSGLFAEAERKKDIAENDLRLAKRVLDKIRANTIKKCRKDKTLDKSLEERLIEMHIAMSLKDCSWSSRINPCSNLLSILCQKDTSYNRMLLILHHNCYELSLIFRDGTQLDLMNKEYEDKDCILTCIDNQELPVILLDVFDSLDKNIYYSGCIIVEIRDHRRKISDDLLDTACELTHVLLKPTTQTMICDSNLMARQENLSPSQQAQLESKIILSTTGPLCLDPSPVVSILARQNEAAKKRFNTTMLCRIAKKFSYVGKNRKKKLMECRTPKEIRLLEFLEKRGKTRKMIDLKQSLVKNKISHQLSFEDLNSKLL